MSKFHFLFGNSSIALLDYLVNDFDTNAVLPSLGILNMKHYKLKDFDTQILAVEQKKN